MAMGTGQPFGSYQNEIYLNGLGGIVPSYPMAFAELEDRASSALPPSVWSYVAGGAGDERTQRANVTAFDHWGLVPACSSARPNATCPSTCSDAAALPLFMAPIGVIGLCAQDGHGDLATARAAARTGVPMVASTLTVDPLEEVADEFGDTLASSSSTPPRTGTSPRASSTAPNRRATRASWSPWTPGSPAGARATSPPPTSPAARPLPRQLHQRPRLPRPPRPHPGGGPAVRGPALDPALRQPPHLGRPPLATVPPTDPR